MSDPRTHRTRRVVRTADPNDPSRTLVIPIDADDEDMARMRAEDPDAARSVHDVTDPAELSAIARQQDVDRRVEAAEADPIRSRLMGFGVTLADELLLGAPSYLAGEDGRRTLEALQEVMPGTLLAGRAAGVALPALLTGGATLGESAGASSLARFLPAGFAQAAGNSAEAAMFRGLVARGVTPRMARGLAVAAGASADGGLSGLQAAITQANIQGTPLDAQELLAGGLFGAGLGLGVGGLLGPIVGRGEISAVAREQAQQVAEAGLTHSSIQVMSDGRLQVIPGVNELNTGLAGDLLTDRWVRAIGGTAGMAESDLRMLAVPGNMARAMDDAGYTRNADRLSTDFNTGLNRARTETIDVLRHAGERQANLRSALAGADMDVSPVQGLLRSRAGLIRNSLESAGQRLVASDVANAGELVRLLDHAAGAEDAAELGVRLDNFLDRVRSNRADEGFQDHTLGGVVRTASSEAEDALSRLGQAGASVSAAHNVLRSYDNAVRDLRGKALKHNISLDEERLDPGVLFASVNDSAFRVKLDLTDDFNRVLSEAHRASELAEEQFGVLAPGLREGLQRTSAEIVDAKQWGQLVGTLRAASGRESQAAGILAALGAGSAAVGGVVGGLVGGPVGAALGVTAGALFAVASHPIGAMRHIAALSTTMRSSRTRLQTSLDTLRTRLTSKAKYRALSQGGRLIPRIVLNLRSRESRAEEYRETTRQLRQLAGNPDHLMDVLASSTQGVSGVHPQLAAQVAMTYVRGIGYLAANLPPAEQVTPFSHLQNLPPSQAEMDSFLRRYEAIEDPISLVDRAANFTLTTEHVDAVRTVYPELYTHIQSEVTGIVGDLEHMPPYSARMALGTLLNIPADPSLDSAFIARMQQRYAQTSQQQQELRPDQNAGPRRTTQGAARAGAHTYSESQSVSMRLGQGVR